MLYTLKCWGRIQEGHLFSVSVERPEELSWVQEGIQKAGTDLVLSSSPWSPWRVARMYVRIYRGAGREQSVSCFVRSSDGDVDAFP